MAGLTDINYNRLLRWLTPPRLRQSRAKAWIKALCAPVVSLYSRFKAWERESWYRLKYQTGQVAYLEYVLNDKFDPVQKRIWIGPGIQSERIYIHLDDETDEPLWLHTGIELEPPVWLYTNGEFAAGWAEDFTVNVPYGLAAEDDTIRAFADRFKRDGKSYAYIKF